MKVVQGHGRACIILRIGFLCMCSMYSRWCSGMMSLVGFVRTVFHNAQWCKYWSVSSMHPRAELFVLLATASLRDTSTCTVQNADTQNTGLSFGGTGSAVVVQCAVSLTTRKVGEGEATPRKQSAGGLETSTIIRMAQQHHHERLVLAFLPLSM